MKNEEILKEIINKIGLSLDDKTIIELNKFLQNKDEEKDDFHGYEFQIKMEKEFAINYQDVKLIISSLRDEKIYMNLVDGYSRSLEDKNGNLPYGLK